MRHPRAANLRTPKPLNPSHQSGRDEFLSEEDLDLGRMSFEERIAYWNLWLRQAQATNNLDVREYSHGVMVGYKEPRPESELPD